MELRRTWGVASALFLVIALSLLLLVLARPMKFVPAEFQLGATSAPAANPVVPAASAAPLATAPAAPATGAPASAAPAATIVPTVVPSSNAKTAPGRLTAPPTTAPSDPGSMNNLDPIGIGDPPSGPKYSNPPKGSSASTR